MATTLLIEEERGTGTGHYHPHPGYYAGDFSGRRDRKPIPGSVHTEPRLRLLTTEAPHRSSAPTG